MGVLFEVRRYESTDAQWGQSKDMISQAKTDRMPKDERRTPVGGGKTTKINTFVDVLGIPVQFLLTAEIVQLLIYSSPDFTGKQCVCNTNTQNLRSCHWRKSEIF